jgi:DNA-binding NarL/FixJ family response regulator
MSASCQGSEEERFVETDLSSARPRLESGVSRSAIAGRVCHDRWVARILIVDDDRRFRGIARALLEAEGLDVVGEAESGGAAIAATRELDPDIVLLDVHLPDIDGFEVAERLLAEGKRPTVIFTSTRNESDLGPRLYRSGAKGFVPKDELSAERIARLCG